MPVPVPVPSPAIVMFAEAGVPMVVPSAGFESARAKDLLPEKLVASLTGMVTVLALVSPSLQASVPLTAV